MLLAFSFLDLMWSMLIFFLWISWIMMVVHVITDVFRRRDASGLNKTAWLIFILFVPFLGVFAYLISNSENMARRNAEYARAARSEADDYIRSVAASEGPAAEIERAKGLRDTGAITEAEFDALKAKALAT